MATQTEIDSLENELESLLVCHNVKSCDKDIGGSNKVTCLKPLHITPSNECNVETLCNMIISSNKDAAKEASEVFTKLSPKECAKINDVRVSSNSLSPNDAFIKERFVEKERFSIFKEKVLATKYRALSYLWKKDLSVRPLRKITPTSQKKLELGLQTISNSCQKKWSSICNRFRLPGMDMILSNYFLAKIMALILLFISLQKLLNAMDRSQGWFGASSQCYLEENVFVANFFT